MARNKQLARIGEPPSAEIIEKVMMQGDLSGLNPEQRLNYYKSVCETLGLNPLTKPFDYLTLDGKLVLYARKDATEQLRKRYGISLKITHREQQEELYVVTAQASLPSGRVDESIGAVPLTAKNRDSGQYFNLKGPALANAVMKAETKAKRRVTLSICGLGMLDESELDTVSPGNDFDQTSQSEIAERRVRQATANATEAESLSTSIQTVDEVTQDNYKEVLCHVGKENGIKWKKVGELDAKVIEWLHDKWLPKNGDATPDNKKLSAAIRFAYSDLKKEPTPDTAADVATDQPPVDKPTEAATAAARDLRGRIQDLILTEDQAISYLRKQGVFAAGWTRLEHAPEGILLYLSTPEGWRTFKQVVEADVKPQPAPEKSTKKGRKK